jgi:hypothetical protein
MTINRISRRAIVAGLASTPLAALPALATPRADDDPALAAFRVYEARRVQVAAVDRLIEEELKRTDRVMEKIGIVRFQGQVIHGFHQMELIFTKAIAATEDACEKDRIRDEFRKCRREFEGRVPEYEAARADSRIRDLEAEIEPLDIARNEAEAVLLTTAPTTRDGALAVLGHVAEMVKDDDFCPLIQEAIRAAMRVFARDAETAKVLGY